MNQKQPSFFISRLASLRHAVSGFSDMLKTQPNAWIHAAMTIFVLALSWFFNISKADYVLIVIAIVCVWVAEAFNTVLELILDMVTLGEYSQLAKRAKDIAAAAVLIASVGATSIGIFVLAPPLLRWLKLN